MRKSRQPKLRLRLTQRSFCWFENIGSDQNDGVRAIIPVPMNGRPRFSNNVARLERLRRTVITNDSVGSLQEIHDSRSFLVIMKANMTTRFYCQHSEPQLTSVHARKFRLQFDRHRLSGRVSLLSFGASAA